LSDVTGNFAPSGQVSSIQNTVKVSPWYVKWLGWLLIVVLCAGYSLNYFEESNKINHQIDRAVVIIGFFILLIGTIFREITRLRKEKYANIQIELHAIHHILRDVESFLSLSDLENKSTEILQQMEFAAVRELGTILDRFAGIFSLLTGTRCRTSIKMIMRENEKLYSYTLARDMESARTNVKSDKKRFEERKDPIENNEDFSLIFQEDERWFFSNNLPKRSTYKNSRDPNIGTGDNNNRG
jgi:hypothetical protein